MMLGEWEMKALLIRLFQNLAAACFFSVLSLAGEGPFRPPAVPLLVHDPYFSIWSMADRLNGDDTRHWTGKSQQLTGIIRVDGIPLRVMGSEPQGIEALPQSEVQVFPTRTIYMFGGRGVALTLTFLSPLLPKDVSVLARPVTYLTWEVRATDGKSHDIALYLDADSNIAVDSQYEPVIWGRFRVNNLDVLRMGSQAQPMLAKAGDDLRIDWGYFCLAAKGPGLSTVMTDAYRARDSFLRGGTLQGVDSFDDPLLADRPRRSDPVLALAFDLGRVSSSGVSRHALLAYDDEFSIELFHQRLRPFWRKQLSDVGALLTAAEADYPELLKRSSEFDDSLMSAMARVGGMEYARLGALAYRQTWGGNKLVTTPDGTPLLFPKENFSNGCISTVDVIYPSAPFFLLFNPEMLKAQLRPVLAYAQMPRWRFPFAPHDLGTYPHANGQVYGGEDDERDQMPVEESGNMLIMAAALAQADGNGDFASQYWPLLTRWAEYLKEKGLDPENQLATNDMSGHLAHNTDLSIKAIIGLGAYGQLCAATHRESEARAYLDLARKYAQEWQARADDGDHYRLAFDRPGTWSQKHNLIWDRVLGLDLFPPEVARKELAFYKTRLNVFGLPFDNRETYTLLDWTVWTASLAESKADFEHFVAPLYRFANESPSRVPLTDYYWTTTGKQRGFQARPVVGGIFVRMLVDGAGWRP
jgi:hypothetical protein